MARILHRRTALPAILTEIRYTLSRVRAHPLAVQHVPIFEDLRTECMQVLIEDFSLLEGVADAQATVDISGETLDGLATRFYRTVLLITGESRNHPIMTYYFGDKTLTEFRRPVLGTQLAEMTRWIPSLQTADPRLQAYEPELIAAVAAATQAAQAKKQAIDARRQFRDLGARRQLVDRLNAIRKEVHGSMAKLPHEHTDLPTSFADLFFRRDPGRSEVEDDDAMDTVEGVLAHLEELRVATAEAAERLAELQAEAEAEAKAAEEKAAEEAAVAEIDKTVAELHKKRAKLVASLEAR